MKTLIKTSAAILGLCTASGAVAGLVVDDFSDDSGFLIVESGNTSENAVNAGVGPLNANREITLDYVAGPGFSDASVVGAGGYFQWNNQFQNVSVASISYSFAATDVSIYDTFKAYDVQADINFNFAIRYESLNGGFTEVVLRSQGANNEVRTFPLSSWLLPAVACPQGPFDPPNGQVVAVNCDGNLDLTQLTDILITFDSVGPAADVGFTQLEFVPVPGTLFLIGGGLLGLGLVRRRANKAAA